MRRPANASPPTISGSPVQGQTLTATTGTWRSSPTSYAYEWRRCSSSGASCVAISGASSSTYVLAAADVGSTIRVAVTATNAKGSATAVSAATAVIQSGTGPTTTTTSTTADTTPPSTPTGFTETSSTQSSVSTSWTASSDPDSPVAGYDVYVNGTKAGTTGGTSYTDGSLQCGTTYTLAVDAYDSSGNTSSKASMTGATSACPVAPSDTTAPAVSGTAQVGQTLSTTNGSWSGSTPMTYTYQWQDCDSTGANCTAVAGATASTYVLTSSDQGHTVRSTVKAANAAGSSTASSAATGAVQAAPAPPAGLNGLRVSGNHVVDNAGNIVRLHGVNRSGTEYACIQGWGIFDGPSDQTSVSAIKSWHVNIVRIPLNEDCWLGINGVASAYSGTNYINAIVNFVNLLHQNGMYAELSLIWGAPGTYQATYQPGGPDEDHSPAFWSSLAATFKNDPNVILAPWGETTTGWTCFMQTGCSNQATYGPNNAGYQTASMQQAVNVMRQAGYNGVIAVPCINYANSCDNYNGSSWLASHPIDPDNNLMAEAHVYGKNTCSTSSCLDTNMGPLAQQFPLIFGETGESYDDSLCDSSYISTFMNWADAHGVGYEAWTWDTWGGCGVLISSYSGTPGNAYGQWVHDHYVATYP